MEKRMRTSWAKVPLGEEIRTLKGKTPRRGNQDLEEKRGLQKGNRDLKSKRGLRGGNRGLDGEGALNSELALEGKRYLEQRMRISRSEATLKSVAPWQGKQDIKGWSNLRRESGPQGQSVFLEGIQKDKGNLSRIKTSRAKSMFNRSLFSESPNFFHLLNILYFLNPFEVFSISKEG